ncbi:MAG: alpha/beta hydrolase [Acidimicrobiia bacterium]|nr:alpha/beta hydrolase [Acidimicrobiia bacterium]
MARAAPRTAAFLARSWMTSRAPGREAERPTLGLAAQVLLDEVLMAAMKNPRLFPSDDDYVRAGRDIDAAHQLWSERGWLDDPAAYHRNPDVPMGCMVTRQRVLNMAYEHLTFPSGYEPHAAEPGRERWLGYEANRTAHAWVVRARDAGRPWLVCVHGWGMGSPFMDLRAFRARRLSRVLGLNLLVPVLPLHGPRQRPGANGGEGFMTIDLIDAAHGLAQAAWDIRSAIRWIRFHDPDAQVGVYGLSLGGYTAALTASLEDGLACVIAGIPATDIVDLYRRHSPVNVRRKALDAGALGPKAIAVHRVVSPLVLAPRPERHKRFLFAGIGDRMSTSRQARRLWEHWDRPAMAWYPGGHVGFFWASDVSRFVEGALASSGLVDVDATGHPPVSLASGEPVPPRQ